MKEHLHVTFIPHEHRDLIMTVTRPRLVIGAMLLVTGLALLLWRRRGASRR